MKNVILSCLTLLILVYAGCNKKSSDDNTPRDCTWSTVFSDDFNRADGPIGNNYFTVFAGTGSADIFNNQLRVSTTDCYWAICYATEVDGNRTRVSLLGKIPTTEVPHVFAIGGKFTHAGQIDQTGYLGYVGQGRLAIMKVMGAATPTEMAGDNYTLLPGHTYLLVFTFDDNVFTLTVSDQTSKNTISVTATETGTLLTGKGYTINGSTKGGSDVLLFDDYLIERCN